MRSLAQSLLFVLCAIAAAGDADAGAPFVTDDPEPVDRGHWEVFFAAQASHASGGWSGSAPLLDANYGAAEDLQLHLIVPFAFDAPEHEPRHYGHGDTEVGAKYRFIRETEDVPQVGVYPLLVLPTGNASRGLGGGRVQAFIPVWIQKSWGADERPWTAYGGGGYWINPGSGNRDWGFVGALLQRRVSDWLTIGGEVYHKTAQQTDGNSSTWLNGGAIVDLNDTVHLVGSAGHNVQGESGFQAFAGVRFNFATP